MKYTEENWATIRFFLLYLKKNSIRCLFDITIIERAQRIEWLPDFHLDNGKKNIERLSDITLLDTNQIIE